MFSISSLLLFLFAGSGGAQESPLWRITGANRAQYAVALDTTQAFEGQYSLRLQPIDAVPDSAWAASEGAIDIRPLAGKHLRVRVYLRTEEVHQAAFWARVHGAQEGNFVTWGVDTMAGREVTGTTDWTPYELVLPAPAEATMLILGTRLRGPGILWADHLTLEAVPDTVPLSAQSEPRFSNFAYREPPFLQPPTQHVRFEAN